MADNTYWQGDRRFAAAPAEEMPDYVANDPVLAEEWRRTHPEAGSDVQVANSDDLDTTRLALMIAGTAGAGALADYLAGAGIAGAGATPAAAQAAAAAPEAAGTVGLAAPAVTGLPGGVLAGGAAIPGAAGFGAVPGAVALEAAAPTLGAATTGLSSAEASALPGATTMGAVPAAAPAAAGGTMSTVGKLTGLGLKAAGAGIGAASNAEAANRGIANDFGLQRSRLELENNDLGLRGYQANTQAKSALENALLNRAQLEAGQRATDLKNLYRGSVLKNPTFSQYNDRPVSFSPELLSAYENVGKQASGELAQAPKYRASQLPELTYEPYTQPAYKPPTMQEPGTMSKVGNWLGPILAGASGYFGGR